MKYKKFLKYLTLTLLFLMPILDTQFFFSRITTLTEILIILFIFFSIFLTNKEARKKSIFLFIYYFLCFIYLIINILRAQHFTSLFPGNFNYSIYRETLTIIKLIIPITLLYCLKYQDITKKNYNIVIKYWILFISCSIIITNIFKISLSSYSSSTIRYNIFEWGKNIYYSFTASKGFFNYANQESAIMILLLVMSFYNLITSKKRNIIYITLLAISMIMLGTRISTIGGLLVLISLSILYIIYIKIFKVKFSKNLLLISIPILIWIIIIPISPYGNRNVELKEKNLSVGEINQEETTNKKENTIDKKEESKKKSKEDELREYIDINHDPTRMPEQFYKDYYSYENDPYFWYEFMQKYNGNGINYRLMEINIAKRIRTINNNKLDYLFGISNSRIQNVVNIERDISLQHYAYGIIGELLLLFIYPLILIQKIKEFIKIKRLFNAFILISIILFIFCSYLSGNIMNYLTTTIPFIFIINGFNKTKKDKIV